jgi:hypothetical protein
MAPKLCGCRRLRDHDRIFAAITRLGGAPSALRFAFCAQSAEHHRWSEAAIRQNSTPQTGQRTNSGGLR